jgi:hypothetical protein
MAKVLIALRARASDAALSHTVKAGRFQLCRVTYAARKCIVTALSPYSNTAEHLDTLTTFDPAAPHVEIQHTGRNVFEWSVCRGSEVIAGGFCASEADAWNDGRIWLSEFLKRDADV